MKSQLLSAEHDLRLAGPALLKAPTQVQRRELLWALPFEAVLLENANDAIAIDGKLE